MHENKTAVLCDLVEVYGILDYKSVPATTLGALVVGLGQDTRVGMHFSGVKVKRNTIILARILDVCNLLMWAQTEDGQKNKNRPQSVTDILLGNTEEKEQESYSTPEEFEKARAKLLEIIGD